MKSTITKPNNNKTKLFLMISKTIGTIVLVNSTNTYLGTFSGMVINCSDNSNAVIGTYRTDWKLHQFRIFNGEVVLNNDEY